MPDTQRRVAVFALGGTIAMTPAAAATMPVVLASRTGSGSVLRKTYGFSGSERDLNSRGLLPAGFLHPLKARLLLAAAIAVAGGYTGTENWPWPAS